MKATLTTRRTYKYRFRLITAIIILGCFLRTTIVTAQLKSISPSPQMAPPNGNPPATPTISGPTSATGGTTSTYSAVTGTSGSTFSWSLSTGGSLSFSGATATVHWTSTYSGAAIVYCGASNAYGNSPLGSKSVTITASALPLTSGALTPSSQTVASGSAASTITSAAATGGSGGYLYQWQSSVDGNTWTPIVNATSLSLSPGLVYGQTFYRLAVTSNTQTAYSSSSVVTMSDCYQLNTAALASMNYIITSTFREPGISNAITDAQISSMAVCDANQTIQYLDALGRPIQTIEAKASSLGNDIVQPMAYDQYGREATKYLPYVTPGSNDGAYRSTALSEQQSYYNPTNSATLTQQPNGVVNTSYPYAITNFESSPLNRVVEQGAPGSDWQPVSGSTVGHTVKEAYGTNASEVILWAINSNGNGATGNTNYAAGTLYKTTTIDENGNSIFEYKDLQGLLVCKMVQNGSINLSTYYVYDSFNNLTYVIPPIPSTGNPQIPAYPTSFLETDPVFINFIYGYHYDSRNRLIQKNIPGKGWEYMVYIQMDQPVLSQDAVQRNNNQWTVTKYDVLGRVIVTGLWNAGSAITQATLQNTIYAGAQWDVRDATNNTTTNPTGYVISSYPALSKVLTTNYYDDYTFTGQPNKFIAPVGASIMTRGLLTGNKTSVLNTLVNNTPDMLWKVNYYDDLGRTTQIYDQHYLGGVLSPYNFDKIVNSYDFANEITGTTRYHYNSTNASSPVLTIFNGYVYDHEGRKKQTTEQINSGTNVILAEDDYNELGQLTTKNLHSVNNGSSYLQNTAYAYNERGWLSKINDPTAIPTANKLFAEQLNYNNVAYGATPQYNGNIAEMDYNASVGGHQHVTYTYDPLNRLIAGNSQAGCSETGISYDDMGNILSLTRNIGGVNNTLTYGYIGNQLITLSGYKAGTNTYDNNGNLLIDGTRSNANITYNLLNLPQIVTANGLSITYTYDANGNKLRKVSNTLGTTDYINGIQYKTNSTVIDFIQTEEGRVLNPTTAPNYEYTLTDHLGNNRGTFDMQNGKTSEDDYYPFGLNVPRLANATNLYLYNKKELQQELNEYDYGARFYDPVIARWTSVDPLAEKFNDETPYLYTYGDPIKHNDPDGKSGEVTIDNNTHTITVSSNMVFYGGGASADLATKTAANVQNQWNAAGGKISINGQEYSVKFSVTGTFRDDLTAKEINNNTDIQNNYIKVDATTNLSSQGSYTDVTGDNLGGNTGFYRTSEITGTDATTGAHEMGHGWGEEHPTTGDLRGQGQPGIMAPRGTIVDPQYQYDPKAQAGDKNGTINPAKRQVTQDNINALGLDKLNYDENGKANLGTLTNIAH